MITAEQKQAWLDNLRSGKFEQETGYLHTSNGYCCLGVLCNTLGYEETYDDICDRYRVTIPEQGCGWVTTIPEGELLPVKLQSDLINMNDTGKNFSEIADYIEEHLKV